MNKYKLNYKKLALFIISSLIIISVIICIILLLLNLKHNNTSNIEQLEVDATVETSAQINDENNVVTVVIEDEKVSEEELKKAKVDKKEIQNSTSPYYIKVNYGANVVTIYKKDKDNKYTVPFKAMVCSCGTYTPKSGTYKTTNKYRWGKLIHNCYGQYSTRIVGSILFHSVPYDKNTNDSLQYEEYDKLGTSASAGCVRLTVADTKWIYDNCPSRNYGRILF